MAQSRNGEVIGTVSNGVDTDERKASEIRDDIDRTRAEMSSTVNEIETRLSPQHVKEQVSSVKEHLIEEIRDVKDRVKAEVREEIHEATDKVKEEFQQAKTAVREATVGKVEHMMHRAGGTVRHAGESMMHAGGSVAHTVRANPIPFAMIGLGLGGLGWLLLGARRRAPMSSSYASFDEPYGYVQDIADDDLDWEVSEEPGRVRAFARRGRERVGDAAVRTKDRMGHAVERTKDAVETAVDRSKGAVGAAIGKASDTVSNVASGASDLAHRAGERISEKAENARYKGHLLAMDVKDKASNAVQASKQGVIRAEQGVEHMMHDSPLAVGAVCFAIGATVGLLLPHTEKEDRLLGEAKQKLTEKLQVRAREALGQVEETAKQALASNGMDEHGFAPQTPKRYGEWLSPNKQY